MSLERRNHISLWMALHRHEVAPARVVPILLRATLWKGAPFSHLECLPKGGRPVASWENRDEAWENVAAGIAKLIVELRRSLVP